jgi:hypothetical protein
LRKNKAFSWLVTHIPRGSDIVKETAEDILDLMDLYLDGWGGMVLVGQVKCLTETMRNDMPKVIEPYKKEFAAKKKARLAEE